MISSALRWLRFNFNCIRLRFAIWRLQMLGKKPNFFHNLFVGMGFKMSYIPTKNGYIRKYTDKDEDVTFVIEAETDNS